MSTGGGGGGGLGGWHANDEEDRGGDNCFGNAPLLSKGMPPLVADSDLLPLLPASLKPRAPWENAWTSVGSNSDIDLMSHYLSDSGYGIKIPFFFGLM
jgi:hypothetical protein